MRAALALAVLACAAAVAVFVVAVSGSQDRVPDDLRDCVRERDGRVVTSQDALGVLRRDLVAGTLPRPQPLTIGDRDALLVEGRSYRVLVLQPEDAPRLDVRAAYLDPSKAGLVAVEQGTGTVLRDCARSAG